MEPITQVLASVALARCGFKRVTPLALPIIVTAGLAPELDWLSVFGGARMFLEAHRTATDSLVGIVVLAALIAATFVVIGRRLGKPVGQNRAEASSAPTNSLRFAPAFFAALAGGGLHVLLDLTNSYGVKLLWPFSARWFAWDLTASLDPWILFLLLAGLLVPALFRMITEEIGAKSKRKSVDRGAVVALALVAAFCSGRLILQKRATAMIAAREYHGEAANTAEAFPQSASPLAWSGVVDTDDTIDEVDVSFAAGATFDPESARVFYKAEASPALEAAQQSDVGAAFLKFARFPLARVEGLGDGHRVMLRDLRFDTGPRAERNVFAEIDVDASNQVTQEKFLFNTASSGEAIGEESGGEK
ncbi:MAG: metal-dependent hydrolase [Candidatus Acidiferrales bacterium]